MLRLRFFARQSPPEPTIARPGLQLRTLAPASLAAGEVAELELAMALGIPSGYILLISPSPSLLVSGLLARQPLIVIGPGAVVSLASYGVHNPTASPVELPAGAWLAEAHLLPVEAPVLMRDGELSSLLDQDTASPISPSNDFVIDDIWQR